jgi:RNA polymerase sigma-70 factor (ECF subfamily)
VTEESQLIVEARQGSSAAFGQLVRRYQDRLYTSVVHVIGCRDEAEDVVQDAFVQAYLKLPHFRLESSFFTWLYRIAFNRAVSRRRRRRPLAESGQPHADSVAPELADPGDSPDDRLLREERAEQVRRALEALSEEHRAIMVLREVDGCDYQAIAEILGISVGTVRSRLHRARSQMRDELKALQPWQSAE